MRIFFGIAAKHLLARKRQSLVSLFGIVLGVGFFLAISSLMKGSENDFIKRLVDNSPHITITDQFRFPRPQPLRQVYKVGAIELRRVTPVTETRGIRGYKETVDQLRETKGVKASPMLVGQALISFAGVDRGITLNGVIPEDLQDVSTIEEHLVDGKRTDFIANKDGIIIGTALAEKLAIFRGQVITVAATLGQVRNFKVVGLFRTGRSDYDETQSFVHISRVQALLNRANRANRIIIKISDPTSARVLADLFEKRFSYKSVSWQEASEDIMNTLKIRNVIMYSVVSAVLVVAAFGIYNVISTVVLEKQRDIAILKSMGFFARDILQIFLIQGILLGTVGCVLGLPFGMLLMSALMQIRFKPPGSVDSIYMPIDWSTPQFVVAALFAMISSIAAGYFPARKAARVDPVEILRGGT